VPSLRISCQIKSRGLLVDRLVNCDCCATAVPACAVCFVRPSTLELALGPDDRTEKRASNFDSSKEELVQSPRLDFRTQLAFEDVTGSADKAAQAVSCGVTLGTPETRTHYGDPVRRHISQSSAGCGLKTTLNTLLLVLEIELVKRSFVASIREWLSGTLSPQVCGCDSHLCSYRGLGEPRAAPLGLPRKLGLHLAVVY
jgi:hypothetical protein